MSLGTYILAIFVYCQKKYIIYLYELLTQVENRAFAKLDWSVLQPVLINFSFTDNTHTLCLSCNAKKSKSTAKFLLKRIEAIVILINLNGVLYHVNTNTVTVSYCLIYVK